MPTKRKKKPKYTRTPELPVSERGETLYTEEEAANYLGVPRRWMREAIAKGYLPVVRFPQYNRFRKADLDAFIEDRLEQDGSAKGRR